MPEPLVSVVMPVYNGRRYLRDAVQSVLAQTLRDFELIAIDDGSTDASGDLLERMAESDPRIVVLRQTNAGATRALNLGISRARGQFVARMDADDVCLPRRFERQVEFLRSHLDHVAVGSAVQMIDPEGNPLCESRWPLTHEELDAATLAAKSIGGLAHPTAMIRTASLREVGAYREKFRVAQDKDLWLRLAEVGRLANLPDVLLKYRFHGESTGARKGSEQQAAFEEAIADACRRRGIAIPARPAVRKSFLPRFPEPQAQLAMYAISGCNFSTARRHARRFWRENPLCWRSWILAALALAAPVIQRLRGKCGGAVCKRNLPASTVCR